MQFGSTPLTGASIAHSFSVDAFLDSTFMSGFIKCLSYDDYFIRPECHGYRIFLDVDVSVRCYLLVAPMLDFTPQ